MKGKKVFVGLSGGVDSAVTAALLKQEGALVVGVFIKGWYPEGLPCTWAEDRKDAMRVAAHLSLPFVTLDASAEYKKAVIDYLLAEYAAGRTPNPDVMCNRDVKFGSFYNYARAHGADAIATGHYAWTEDGRLYRGTDEEKDQSYFLWAVSPEALAYATFPLGKHRKGDVRRIATRLRLPVASKKDSQGICFLGEISVADFLKSELGATEGVALSEDGSEIGRHSGALLYTLGERIALMDAPQGPWYVLAKDLSTNRIVVGRKHEAMTDASGVILRDTNWFAGAPGEEVEAEYRYHGPRVRGVLEGSTFTPRDAWPETPTSGQSLVLYRENECLGGGIIT